MTLANNLDPDEAPQNVGLHLRSKLFDIQIIYRHTKLVRNKDFLQILKKKIFKKELPSMQRVKSSKSVKYLAKQQGGVFFRGGAFIWNYILTVLNHHKFQFIFS